MPRRKLVLLPSSYATPPWYPSGMGYSEALATPTSTARARSLPYSPPRTPS